MSGIGWLIIIVAGICTLSAIYYFNRINRRRKKLGSVKPDILHEDKESDTQTTEDKCLKPPTIEYEGDEAPDIYERPKARKSSRRTAPRYYSDEDGTKPPGRYDYNKRFEESIITPFIDELSPASPYLYEVYRLENEGADQNEIDRLLRKADEVDPQTTRTFRLRLSIIKKREVKERQRYPKLE